jgi:hypothetical protein
MRSQNVGEIDQSGWKTIFFREQLCAFIWFSWATCTHGSKSLCQSYEFGFGGPNMAHGHNIMLPIVLPPSIGFLSKNWRLWQVCLQNEIILAVLVQQLTMSQRSPFVNSCRHMPVHIIQPNCRSWQIWHLYIYCCSDNKFRWNVYLKQNLWISSVQKLLTENFSNFCNWPWYLKSCMLRMTTL